MQSLFQTLLLRVWLCGGCEYFSQNDQVIVGMLYYVVMSQSFIPVRMFL